VIFFLHNVMEVTFILLYSTDFWQICSSTAEKDHVFLAEL